MGWATTYEVYKSGDHWAGMWYEATGAGATTTLIRGHLTEIIDPTRDLLLHAMNIYFEDNNSSGSVQHSPRIYTTDTLYHFLTPYTTPAASAGGAYCWSDLDIPIHLEARGVNTPAFVQIQHTTEALDSIRVGLWGTYISTPQIPIVQPVSVESIKWFAPKPKVGPV